MKRFANYFLNKFGYEIHRKKPSRSSMRESLLWLSKHGFKINTVIDVGASDGRWSADCQCYFPEANYILFEPQPIHAQALDDFSSKSASTVTIAKKAVGNTVGHTFFDVSNPFGGALCALEGKNKIEVPLTTIDAYLVDGLSSPSPYLLKLDTHGFERGILDGSLKTLEKCSVLIIEAYNYRISEECLLFYELCDYLDNKGFRPIDLVDILYRDHDNSMWQFDIIFIRKEWDGFLYNKYK